MTFISFLDEKHHQIHYEELGFSVISHIDGEMITEKIAKYYNENEGTIFLKYKRGKVNVRKDNFLKKSIQYFEEQLQGVIEQDVCSIPYVDVDDQEYDGEQTIPDNLCTIMKTMKKWCTENNQGEGSMKGLVIYGFSLDDCLNLLKFPEIILENKIVASDSEKLSELIIAYNPSKRLIFLIRKGNLENLANDIKVSTNDIIKFVLVFFDVLKGSGVRVTNLLVTDQKLNENQFQCKFCNYQVILMESIESVDSFKKWLKYKNQNLSASVLQEDNEKFAKDFCAKLLFLVTTSDNQKKSHFCGMLPLKTDIPAEQMEEAKFLTPEELKIIYSKRKRHMVFSCYGSGISMVARKRAEIISGRLKDRLKVNESLHFICYSSNHKLQADKKYSNIKLRCNENLKNLFDIIKETVENEVSKNKIHIVAEQWDTGWFSDTHAMELGKMLNANEKLKDSYMFFAFGNIKIERMMKNSQDQHSPTWESKIFNRFNIDKEMLQYNKRNPMEINKLIVFTAKELKDKSTTFNLPLQDINETYPHFLRNAWKEIGNEDKHFTFDEIFEFYYRNKDPVFSSDESSAGRFVESHFKNIIEPSERGLKIKSDKPSIAVINYAEGGNKESMIKSLSKLFDKIIYQSYRDEEVYERTFGYCLLDKHVVLHFDVQNNIPEYFDAAFQLLGIKDNVTDKYEEFNENEDKNILICNYRSFRGFENPSVIVVVDPSLYHLKHCVLECLSRATVFLEVIVIKMLTIDKNQDSQETFQRIITSWKNENSRNKSLFRPCSFHPGR